MKKEEIKSKNEKDKAEGPGAAPASKPATPEHGADSQLHNYNVALTRLGDLFGDDEEQLPPKK